MGSVRLSKRLGVIAGYIEKGASVADIGTDHGYLPVYLAQHGLARRIIASDVSERSLNPARHSAAKYGVEDRIEFIAAPGLSGIGEFDADTVVLAGMGGETIIGILSGAPWVICGGIRLILQPQSKNVDLYLWLRGNDISVHDAALARDSGRIYVVLSAGADGRAPAICDPELEILSLLAKKCDPLFAEYMEWLIAKARLALNGMEKSGTTDCRPAAKRLERLIDLYNIAAAHEY